MVKKEYTNGEITVVWQPTKCSHAGECVKALPNVYKPKEKPWITLENATTEELKSQINKCPSGALSFYMNNEEQQQETAPAATEIKVIPNGPLMVFGDLQVTDGAGNVVMRSNKTTFCRCGESKNQPFCDGTHKTCGFQG